MSARYQDVVLLECGTFNPITIMHLRMFELARDYLHRIGPNRVLAGLLSPVSCQYTGAPDLETVNHRCEMVRLATAGSDWLALDRWEADQPEWTATKTVLAHIKEKVHFIRNMSWSSCTVEQKGVANFTSHDFWLGDLMKMYYSEDWRVSTNRGDSSSLVNTQLDIKVMLLCGEEMFKSFFNPELWKKSDLEIILRDFGVVCITRPDFNPKKLIYESDLLHKFEGQIHLVTEWMTNDISSAQIRRTLRRGCSIRYLVHDAVLQYIQQQELYGGKRPQRLSLDHETTDQSRSGGTSSRRVLLKSSSIATQMSTERSSRECQTRLTSLGNCTLLIDPQSSTDPAVTTGRAPCVTSFGALSPGEEALLRLVKECHQCGSRRVRLMIVEGVVPGELEEPSATNEEQPMCVTLNRVFPVEPGLQCSAQYSQSSGHFEVDLLLRKLAMGSESGV